MRSVQKLEKAELVGFVELQVGSIAVQVPVRATKPDAKMPLATFETEGEACAILIRGEQGSSAVENAMGDAVKEAFAHLSKKLLN